MTRLSIEIALPAPLEEFVQEQVTKGRYGDSAAYVRDLLTHEQLRHDRAGIDAMLLEALESSFADLSRVDFQAIRQRA
jgi:putative addiction module CopG family antidote